MSFSLGFIGFGEAAYNMGKGLKGEGLEDIKAYDVVMDKEGPMRDTVLKRCGDSKIKPVFSAKELVENSDFVVIAVPARFTASTADGLRKFARAGQLFADVTTALPPVKEAQAKAYAEIGADYIDSAIMIMCCVGAYSSNSRVFDVQCVLFFALLGLLFKCFRIPSTPLIIGFILGSMFEENLRMALQASHGNWLIFVQRPISLGFLIVAVVFCTYTVISNLRAKKKAELEGKEFHEPEEGEL